MKKNVLLLVSALTLTGLVTSCNSEDNPSEVQKLEVSIDTPTKEVLDKGESLHLVARTKHNTENLTATWSSSAPEIISVDENGTVKGLKAGEATITCTVGEVSASVKLTVAKDITVSIKTPAKARLLEGETMKLEADVQNNRHNLPTTWLSSAIGVISVASDGTLTAHLEGKASIRAQVGEVISEPVEIEVIKQIAVNIKAPERNNIFVAETLQLEAEVQNNVDELPIVWTSSEPTVATISETGLVTAIKAGTTKITAKVGEITSTELTITVAEQILATEITPSIRKSAIGVGETVEIEATILPEDTTDKSFTVESSDELKISVDGHKITGVALTETDKPITITVKTANGKSGTLEVSVIALSDSILPDIKTRLAESVEAESTHLVSGKEELIQSKADGTVTKKETFDYEIFNDKNVKIRKTSHTSYNDLTDEISYGVTDKGYIIVDKQTGKDGVTKDGYSTGIKEIVEADAKFGQVTESRCR